MPLANILELEPVKRAHGWFTVPLDGEWGKMFREFLMEYVSPTIVNRKSLSFGYPQGTLKPTHRSKDGSHEMHPSGQLMYSLDPPVSPMDEKHWWPAYAGTADGHGIQSYTLEMVDVFRTYRYHPSGFYRFSGLIEEAMNPGRYLVVKTDRLVSLFCYDHPTAGVEHELMLSSPIQHWQNEQLKFALLQLKGEFERLRLTAIENEKISL